ncbi:substrate-binding domain-containing protein [Lucifera butyrica]|uniref:substrate-binding domain-containing protein n=1 Tax=Lucifera butyrica TaxID=1351585 RepID=UPI001A9D84C2|nr:substrate-binding domain-containing protein [Lucifera butyrica]
MTLFFSGCATEQERAEERNQIQFLIGVSQANLIEPWRVVMTREIKEEAGKHKHLRVVFTDAAQSSQKQINDVEKLLQQGIDLLIISPNDASVLTPVVAKAYKKIPVIVLDRAVEGYDYTLFIGPDNHSIGKQAGKFVADLLGSRGGNIIEIQGLNGSPPVRDRSEGFQEVIDKYGNIKILDRVAADWQRDKAEDEMKKILKKYPDVDIVFAHNDPMALGAYKATRELGLQGVSFVGIDGLPGANGGLQLVKDGILQGTFTCPTGGKEAVQYAIDILNHEKGIPKKIILRSNKITRDNVALYTDRQNEPVPNVKAKHKIVLGFSQLGRESQWRLANSASIKQAAKDEGIELLFTEADQKQELQIQSIRDFIKQKVDVIAFAPVVEDGWEEVLQEAKTAGIPVIISDRTVNLDDSMYTTFIGADFEEEGRRAARWLVQNMQGRTNVNIVELQGTVGSTPAIDRKKGFEEILREHPQFKIVDSETGDFTRDEGKKVMEDCLRRNGTDIQAVFAHNDDMALGAIEAIEESGLKPGKDIVIVSIDATKNAFNAMLAGKLNCTVECNPLLGPQLMKAVKTLVAGRQLPVRIITSEEVFSQEVARKELPYRKY